MYYLALRQERRRARLEEKSKPPKKCHSPKDQKRILGRSWVEEAGRRFYVVILLWQEKWGLGSSLCGLCLATHNLGSDRKESQHSAQSNYFGGEEQRGWIWENF